MGFWRQAVPPLALGLARLPACTMPLGIWPTGGMCARKVPRAAHPLRMCADLVPELQVAAFSAQKLPSAAPAGQRCLVWPYSCPITVWIFFLHSARLEMRDAYNGEGVWLAGAGVAGAGVGSAGPPAPLLPVPAACCWQPGVTQSASPWPQYIS